MVDHANAAVTAAANPAMNAKAPRARKKKSVDPEYQDRESSVRLAGEVSERYETMSEQDGSQKTTVLNLAIYQLTQTLLNRPDAFRGPKRRPWLKAANQTA